MTDRVADIAFTAAVKAAQASRGSREMQERILNRRDWQCEITPDLAEFLSTRDSFYFATANTFGQPYIQHRGGPPGFLRVLGPRTLGLADFAGNKQYISLGNLSENDRVHLFLMDYPGRQRVKIWGRARVVDDDTALLASLSDTDYATELERALLISVDAWTRNCPAHITPRHDETTIAKVTEKLTARIRELEVENAELRSWLGKT